MFYGGTEALHMNELYQKHYAKLCEIAYRLLRDRDDARDVGQKVLIHLWEKRASWPTIVSMEAYLFTVTYRMALGELKKKKRNFMFGPVDTAKELSSHEQPGLEYQELYTQIMDAIDKLPTRCKEIFLLSREEELSYKEIAQRLSLSSKTVEIQIGIALKKLREALRDHPNQKTIFFLLCL